MALGIHTLLVLLSKAELIRVNG